MSHFPTLSCFFSFIQISTVLPLYIIFISISTARFSMNIYGFGYRKNLYLPRKNLHYTLIAIPVINRTMAIHRNRYHFDEKLGKGAYGEVYAARRLSDGKRVAIKVISTATRHSTANERLKMLFRNEIQMSKILAKTSRHIIHMYDYDFHQNGLGFIVMELGQQDLAKALSSRPPLSPAERKAMWRQLVNIAMTLYNHGIVHLDIKPGNLVIFPRNVIKLGDMGSASRAHRTRFGPHGSIPYSAPEVTQASYSHMTINSTTADVWSWGAVLYHMTYNRPPDVNYTPPCYRPPDNQPSARDPHLLSVLRHTLVLDPNERYETPWLAQHPYTKTP